jgi:integrase
VFVVAYCGLRWSELAGLRVRDIDLPRRQLNIEQAVTEVNGGRLELNSPKNTNGAPCRSPASSSPN